MPGDGWQTEPRFSLEALLRRELATQDPVPHPGALDAGAARKLLEMRANVVDARRAMALKRNVHEVVIDAPAAQFAESLATTLAEPDASFGFIHVRRPADRVGEPFAVGDRFTGAFQIAAAAAAWGAPSWLRTLLDRAESAGILAWLENRLTSDHAELVEMHENSMAYRYLRGTPLAGESRYTITPRSDGACTLTVTFAFQETTGFAVLLLHGFGIRQHDLAVLAQAEAAARRIGARVVAHTIQSAA